MKLVYIIPGLFEGKLTAQSMRRELLARGFSVTNDAQAANYVITHSGGHLLLGTPPSRQKLLIIDPTFPNERTILASTLHHAFYDIRTVLGQGLYRFYIVKTLLNILYMFVGVFHTIKLSQQWRSPRHSIEYWRKRSNTILTFSDDDSWGAKPKIVAKNVYFFHTNHDDCWQNPGKYVDLLQ